MTPAKDLVSAEYEKHKPEVIRTVAGKLSAKGIGDTEVDLEASYNEAWHALYVSLTEGTEVENRVGYLVAVTYRRALNEYRALRVSRRASPEALEGVSVEVDVDARLDAEVQLRQVREGFRASLSDRELQAATLCHVYGLTRPEAAEVLGVRPKRMEKIMDGASAKINSVVESVQSGDHCNDLRPTIRAFALGLLDPDGPKYALACEHLDHCPACRREVRIERGLAAIGPPLPVAFAVLTGGSGGLATGGAIGLKLVRKRNSPKKSKHPASTGMSAVSTGMVIGGSLVVVATAVGIAFATGWFDGGESSSGDRSTTSSRPESAIADQAATPQSDARAMAARLARIRAAKKAAKRERARAAKAKQQPQPVAEVDQASPPEPESEPVYGPEAAPPAEPPPDPVSNDPQPASPEPTTADATEPADQKPITNASKEFGLR